MSTDTVWTRHAISGVVDNNTPTHIARHPVLGKYLVEVPEGTKPLVPELINQIAAHDVDANESETKLPDVTVEVIEKEQKSEAPNKNGKD